LRGFQKLVSREQIRIECDAFHVLFRGPTALALSRERRVSHLA
jgi:hypothetical protein